MAIKKDNNIEETKETKAVFTKRQLATSERYRGQRDIINALLNENAKYTIEETDNIINRFLKGGR